MIRFRAHVLVRFAALAVVLGMAACTAPDPSVTRGGIFDPYEQSNRKTHELNRALDRTFVRPAGKAYGGVIPRGMQENVGNFADNLSAPSLIVNNVLQGDARGGAINLFRFAINSTFGLGGIIDAASEFGVHEEDTDFGETLHVWGAEEGAYIELPVLGPSTQRDTFGTFVDFFTNPLRYVLENPAAAVDTGTGIGGGLSRRSKFSETIDQILYESTDSYAQSRSLYLQGRRFELGGTAGENYDDPYGSDDPTAALEDPYDQ